MDIRHMKKYHETIKFVKKGPLNIYKKPTLCRNALKNIRKNRNLERMFQQNLV